MEGRSERFACHPVTPSRLPGHQSFGEQLPADSVDVRDPGRCSWAIRMSLGWFSRNRGNSGGEVY